MPNALLTGISGLRGHQKMLEVVGNNLANLNTTAFKASRVLFSDLMYQTQRNATSSGGLLASMNAVQVGTGSTVSQVDLNLQQGNLEVTSSELDLAINGGGFFVGMSGSRIAYTRAGSFKLDESGFLSEPSTGNLVKRFGTFGEQNALGPSFQTSGDDRIYIPIGASIPGAATEIVEVSGNLNSQLTGPVAQTLISSAPFLVGGVPVSAATLLNDVDSNTVDYIAGDKIRISGRRPDGSAPEPTDFSLTPANTVGDLIAALNTAFSGATVTLDSAGNLVAMDDATGTSMLRMAIADGLANSGQSDFDQHEMIVTDVGKDADVELQTVQVYDIGGAVHSVSLRFTQQADGSWNMKATIPPGEGTVLDGDVEGITFEEEGSFSQVTGRGIFDSNISIQFKGLSTPQTMDISFGAPGALEGLTQRGLPSSLKLVADGFVPGKLTETQIDTDGKIYGLASNGVQIALAQLAIASFRNPDGLLSIGGNYFQASLASGDPEFGTALNGNRGEVRAGQLEGSNVDLALEFTRLIIAQRGFSANARTITVTDQILQELTNLIG